MITFLIVFQNYFGIALRSNTGNLKKNVHRLLIKNIMIITRNQATAGDNIKGTR